MSDERPALAAVPGLARIPGPPARRPTITPEPRNTPSDSGDEAAPSTPATALTTSRAAQSGPAQPPREARRSQPASRQAATLHHTTFTTTVTLRDLLRERVRSTPQATIAQVVFDAVAAHADHLDDLVSGETRDDTNGGSNELFPHATSTRHHSSEPRVTEQLIAANGNFDVLDKLVKQSGARSRSQLITAVLRAALQQRR